MSDQVAGPVYRHAGFWWRVLAFVIDGMILGILAAIVDRAGSG